MRHDTFDMWKQRQVNYYGGKYSIQRLLALDEYTQKTSLWRVVLVCACTPLPMVSLVFIQESIPLQNPLDGWSANYGLWIRAVVLVWEVINGLVVQATYLIDDFHVTVHQFILLSGSVSIGVAAVTMLTASILIFPIPFFVLTTMPLFYGILMISFRLIMGGVASATSIAGVMAITITDLTQTFVMLYGLQQRTSSLLSRLERAVDIGTPFKDSNILTTARSLCCNQESYE
ncbi:hypothetical protein PHYSODRAFT_332055 [Phytophthora sojae]|uniref:Uncharacterized protein n=1 Tax=Phytophthora sojae (strain P6497) TaxID=1094619 RepID=G4ZJE5_PHYSP|nr:hypothetical protein PHYSODRAFT_332055 [Phytophthora sojae]EGZ18219.1 hypothetical protein PHYSODRAFT_332055 [Phytophthora sojae]|eukprot:XP_009527277.1 hypothetical protein PHYSODRAFT_332055 [Phytophthora sojae]